MTVTKNIGYAYPTSPLATELGYGKSGCHYVAVFDTDKPITKHDVVYACRKLSDAIYMAPTVVSDDLAWGMYSFYKGD